MSILGFLSVPISAGKKQMIHHQVLSVPPHACLRAWNIKTAKNLKISMKYLALAAVAFALPTDEVPVENIVGGTPVSPPFKYPWLVSLQNRGSHFCGGSLLNANTIITAAHCSQRSVSDSLRVFANRHNLRASAGSENALEFRVTKITNHPNYSTGNYAFDASIWKVQLASGDATRIPGGVVQLDDGSVSADGADMIIGGWGTTSSGGSASSILLETVVDIVPTAECKKGYSNLHPSSICAARPGKDTCQGDSGGPMFAFKDAKPVLVGLTSYGQGCASPGFPGVYARVTSFRDWITNQL
jgi:trypsin